MNLYHHSSKRAYSAFYSLLLIYVLISPTMAQKNIAKKGQEAKKMIEELKETETELREQLVKDIQEKRESTIETLVRLERKYRRNDKNGEADSIEKEIERLRDHFAKNLPIIPSPEEPAVEEQNEGNNYVIFEKKYEFSGSKISGHIVFNNDNIVELSYTLNGSQNTEEFTFQPKSNHLYLDTKSNLGKIYISEIPNSGRLAIMLRWGGDIKHEISTATIK